MGHKKVCLLVSRALTPKARNLVRAHHSSKDAAANRAQYVVQRYGQMKQRDLPFSPTNKLVSEQKKPLETKQDTKEDKEDENRKTKKNETDENDLPCCAIIRGLADTVTDETLVNLFSPALLYVEVHTFGRAVAIFPNLRSAGEVTLPHDKTVLHNKTIAISINSKYGEPLTGRYVKRSLRFAFSSEDVKRKSLLYWWSASPELCTCNSWINIRFDPVSMTPYPIDVFIRRAPRLPKDFSLTLTKDEQDSTIPLINSPLVTLPHIHAMPGFESRFLRSQIDLLKVCFLLLFFLFLLFVFLFFCFFGIFLSFFFL